MNKVLAVILSLYMFALTTYECQDTVDSHTSKNEISQVENTHQHDNHEGDKCSPICVCECCGIVVSYQSIDFIEIINPVISISDNFPEITSQVFIFTTDIDQPPIV
ncbi:DUF6660 family protein [Aureivirga marina]|uniref:DUF6660 family protein n=1 Tax=Aureivirga marina TaxID=1182451 RepID=UPI0018CB725B|nr:DUF6660 family protein [Aureivirga marina]